MKITQIILCSLLTFFCASKIPEQHKKQKLSIEYSLNNNSIEKKEIVNDTIKFMNAIAEFEARGKIDVVNRYGMLGKYQFSPKTLKHLGFYVDHSAFLQDEQMQDSAMVLLIENNKKALRWLISRFDKKIYNGIEITTSGILAGAHLVGVGGVMAYFYPTKYSYSTYDGNGVHVEYYIKKFGGYDI